MLSKRKRVFAGVLAALMALTMLVPSCAMIVRAEDGVDNKPIDYEPVQKHLAQENGSART